MAGVPIPGVRGRLNAGRPLSLNSNIYAGVNPDVFNHIKYNLSRSSKPHDYYSDSEMEKLSDLANKAAQFSQILFDDLRDGNVSEVIEKIKTTSGLVNKILIIICKDPYDKKQYERDLKSYINWLGELFDCFCNLSRILNKKVWALYIS